MRGCLFVLVLAAAVLGSLAWFGSPVVASAIIQAALEGSGYHAATSTVRATSNPPPKLLLGRADRVDIEGEDVDFRTFHAARLDLALTDVDVVARTAGGVSGRIDGAELRTTDGVAAVADVSIEGTGGTAAATINVEGATVDRVVRDAFQRQFDVALTAVALVAPNVLRISAGLTTVEGRLEVDAAGAIALRTPLGSSAILHFDPSFPIRLDAVAVAGSNLRIDATLDTEALLGG
ncbi:MAG: hypothetical protein H0U52_17165 [Chloroflexi bacterium]|nr:hypothetical protein [Chloroflexota bacterium]